MPEFTPEHYQERIDFLRDSIYQQKHQRHAEILLKAIEHFIQLFRSHALSTQLLHQLNRQLVHAGLPPLKLTEHASGPTNNIMSFDSNALKNLDRESMKHLDSELFREDFFYSINSTETFKAEIKQWQNRYPYYRRIGRLYEFTLEKQTHHPIPSLQAYHQSLLNDLDHYILLIKDNLSSCHEKIHSLCANLIILEQLKYLDDYVRGPNVSMSDRIQMIQITHEICKDHFHCALDRSLPLEKYLDLNKGFTQLIQLILCRYLDNHAYSLFDSEDATFLRKALISCCKEMQDRTSPLKQGQPKRRKSSFQDTHPLRFEQCNELIQTATHEFREQHYQSLGAVFLEQHLSSEASITNSVTNITPASLIDSIRQHWKKELDSANFSVLLNDTWVPKFLDSLTPIWEAATKETHINFQSIVSTYLYNFALPEISTIHRMALVLDCIDEAKTMATTPRETEVLDTIQQFIHQDIVTTFSRYNLDIPLGSFFGLFSSEELLNQQWSSLPLSDLDYQETEELQAIRMLLVDCSGEKRQAIMRTIPAQYPDEANKNRHDKRQACQPMVQAIENSLDKPRQIANTLKRYINSGDPQRIEEIIKSRTYIPNIHQDKVCLAMMKNDSGPTQYTKAKSVFLQSIHQLQAAQGPLQRDLGGTTKAFMFYEDEIPESTPVQASITETSITVDDLPPHRSNYVLPFGVRFFDPDNPPSSSDSDSDTESDHLSNAARRSTSPHHH